MYQNINHTISKGSGVYRSSRGFLREPEHFCEPLAPRRSPLGVSWYVMGPDGRESRHPQIPSRFDYLDCPNGYCSGSQSRGYVTSEVCAIVTGSDPKDMLPL